MATRATAQWDRGCCHSRLRATKTHGSHPTRHGRAARQWEASTRHQGSQNYPTEWFLWSTINKFSFRWRNDLISPSEESICAYPRLSLGFWAVFICLLVDWLFTPSPQPSEEIPAHFCDSLCCHKQLPDKAVR